MKSVMLTIVAKIQANANQIDLVKRTVTLTETKKGSTRTVPLSHSAALVK